MTRSADDPAAPPPIPAFRTPGQRRRFRRNILILLCSRAGASQRFIADVFELPRSHVANIIRDMERYGPPQNPL